MPAPATAKNLNTFNPEKYYDPEQITPEMGLEQRRAANLKKAMAAARMQKTRKAMAEREAMPAAEERELVEQEYGRPKLSAVPDQEEAGEEYQPDQNEQERGGGMEQEEEITSERSQNAMREIGKLQARGSMLNRQIRRADMEMEKKLKPAKNALRFSRLADRSKNALRVIRGFGAVAVALWWTLVVPLLMLLLILAVILLTFCGISFGPGSARTKELRKKFEEQKKTLTAERDQQVKPQKEELSQINQKINNLYKEINYAAV